MSASDAAPLPRLGEVFFDVGDAKRYPEVAVAKDLGAHCGREGRDFLSPSIRVRAHAFS